MIEFEINTVEKVEKLAQEKLNAIKLEENLYIIPANVAKSEIVSVKDNYDYTLFGALKEELKALEVNKSDCLTICCKEELEDNRKVMELINLDNTKVIEFEITSELQHEDREELVNYIASQYEGKEVLVTFYLPYDFEMLKNIVNQA